MLEYIPETVYKVARHYSKDEQTIPISFIKVCEDLDCKIITGIILLYSIDICLPNLWPDTVTPYLHFLLLIYKLFPQMRLKCDTSTFIEKEYEILNCLFVPTAVHVPVIQKPCIHPFAGHLSPGHKASEPATGPQNRGSQIVRLRFGKAPCAWRA